MSLLSIDNLHLEFQTSNGPVKALSGISFEVNRGEIFGVVGETGCGKTVTGLSVLGLLPESATISQGRIDFDGADLLSYSQREMHSVRGKRIAMIFQNPATSLNPVFSIGQQMSRVMGHHLDLPRREIRERMEYLLRSVGLPDVRRIMRAYPHQLSGGQQQRVMIAMAISCKPDLIIADEPTTALDVTIQAQILEQIKDLRDEFGISVVLITHNLGVVAETCDRLAVLYAGRVVETGPTVDIFTTPQHPYTHGLLGAVPRPGMKGGRLTAIEGTVPSNPAGIRGCAFAPRCEFAMSKCTSQRPDAYTFQAGHQAACFLVEEATYVQQ